MTAVAAKQSEDLVLLERKLRAQADKIFSQSAQLQAQAGEVERLRAAVDSRTRDHSSLLKEVQKQVGSGTGLCHWQACPPPAWMCQGVARPDRQCTGTAWQPQPCCTTALHACTDASTCCCPPPRWTRTRSCARA